MICSGRPGFRLTLLCAAVVLLCTHGCLLGVSRTVKVQGDAALKRSLDVAREGTTTRDDIVKALGKPTQTLKLKGDTEQLVYVAEREDKFTFCIIFVALWKSESERTVRHIFELEEGVLVRCWREEF